MKRAFNMKEKAFFIIFKGCFHHFFIIFEVNKNIFLEDERLILKWLMVFTGILVSL